MATSGQRDLAQSPTGSQRETYFGQQRTERSPQGESSAPQRVVSINGSRFRERLSKSSERNRGVEEPSSNDPSSHHNSSSTSGTKASSSDRRGLLQQERQGLTELTAPRPIQSEDVSHPWRRKKDLESAKYNWDDQEDRGLTELRAPRPIQNEDDYRDHLESEKYKQSQQDQTSDESSRLSNFMTQVYIVCYLIFFSIFGTLARIGTQWLTFYPGAPVVTSNLWANLGGTFIMGFLVEDRQIFREEWGEERKWDDDKLDEQKKGHLKVKKTIPLYVGLTVGFCGSYTSFSTFMRDMFLALSNDLPTPINHPGDFSPITKTVPRNDGYSFLAVLGIAIIQIMVNISGLHFGAQCARAIDKFTPTLPYKFIRKVLDPLMVVLGIGCWIGAIIMSILPPDRPGGTSSRGPWSNETWRGLIVFSLVFSPPGALLRFLLSIKLNSLIAWFPLGTFAANIFGTAVLASAYDLQHAPLLTASSRPAAGGGRVGCQVLQGIEDGFCGCLTTVSTWVTELTTLEKRHAYLYGAASVLGGFALIVAIMGGVRWSIGFSDIACAIVDS